MEGDDSRVFLAALKMLSRRDFFRAELRDRLVKKEFGIDVVEESLKRCEEMGYLNDSALAFRFAELRGPARGWGPLRLRAELMSRGVDQGIARKASHLSDEISQQAMATAIRRAETRAREGWWRTGEGRALMVSSLLRRGFEPEEAHRAMGRQCKMREAEDHANDDQPGNPEGIS